MNTTDSILLDSALRPRGDAFDAERAELKAAIESDQPNLRALAYGFAGTIWEPIAVDAWNDGERSPEILTTAREIRDLCRWTIQRESANGDERFDIAGSQTVEAMMHHILGDDDEAVTLLRKATDRPTNAYFWESATEKLATILINANRIDEALDTLRTLQAAHPHNTFAENCLSAYEIDQANEAAIGTSLEGFDIDEFLETGGGAPSPDQAAVFMGLLGENLQRDCQAIMASGASPEDQSAEMQAATEKFQAAIQKLSELS